MPAVARPIRCGLASSSRARRRRTDASWPAALLGGLLALSPVCGAVANADAGTERRILVFGDSLTWGWTPVRPTVPVRQPPERRWTTALDAALGPGHTVLADGLNGRTTDIADADDPALDGSAALPSVLAAHAPLDLVILLLGTNDTKAGYDRSAFEIGLGAIELIDIVHRSGAGREPSPAGTVGHASADAVTGGVDGPSPDVLLISPPPLAEAIDPGIAPDFAGARAKSLWLGTLYAAIAEAAGTGFVDAGSIVSTDGIDGVHLTAEANAVLGRALAGAVSARLD